MLNDFAPARALTLTLSRGGEDLALPPIKGNYEAPFG